MVAALEASHPSVRVLVNEKKQRKGSFEIRVNGRAVLSLTDMVRPFPPLKALDMPAVIADVQAAVDEAV